MLSQSGAGGPDSAVQGRLKVLEEHAIREEPIFLQQWARHPFSEFQFAKFEEAFKNDSSESFVLLARDHPKYAFHLHLLAEIYKSVDRLTIRWMDHIYDKVSQLHPDKYLLSVDVIHEWRNVFHSILQALPAAMKSGNLEYDLQMSGIRWASEPWEWRSRLIEAIQKDLLPEQFKMVKRIEERELLLLDYFFQYERSSALLAQDHATTIRKRHGFKDQNEGTPEEPSTLNSNSYEPPNLSLGPHPITSSDSIISRVVENIPTPFQRGSFSVLQQYLADSSTVLALYALIAAGSALCIGMAITSNRAANCTQAILDDGFYTTLSQALLSIFSLYCIVVPLVRSHVVPAFRSWFWFSLLISAVTGIATVAVYPFSWKASIALGFTAGATQVIATIQLIEGLHQAVQREDLNAAITQSAVRKRLDI